jgi:hypothetical protein
MRETNRRFHYWVCMEIYLTPHNLLRAFDPAGLIVYAAIMGFLLGAVALAICRDQRIESARYKRRHERA